MTDNVEKSCWGITLWAVAIVLGLVVIGSVVTAPNQAAKVETKQNAG